jgi:hypothetical protein
MQNKPNITILPYEENELYPLPQDYWELGTEGQRAARLHAVRNQKTPEDLVWAWSFFRSWYLLLPGEGSFYKRWKPSPAFHYQMIGDIGRYPRNAVAAPRASAKTTVLAVEVPLLMMLTRENFHTLLILSKETTVSRVMKTKVARQLTTNKRILEDFGEVKPPSRGGAWNDHMLQSRQTGSILEAAAVKGALQGHRPDLCLVDDPEVDGYLQKIDNNLVENYEEFLMGMILPMLERGQSSLYWSGTLLSKRCFLHYVVTTRTDERFLFWNRRLYDAEDDGHGKLLWEEKWDHETLEHDKKVLGLPAYNAQRRNRPGTREEQVMWVDEQLGTYEVEDLDWKYGVKPLTSEAKLISRYKHAGKIHQVERPFGKTVTGMYRILLMDWAKCASPTSDYIAMAVVGVENSTMHSNTWWVLDLMVKRLPGYGWVPVLWEMALKWGVKYVGIEAVAAQSSIVDTFEEYRDRMALAGWTPRVVAITHPRGLQKEDRIMGISWRFKDSGKIKLPGAPTKFEWPWKELYGEIEGFTGEPGGTQYDDALDAVSMINSLFKGPVRGSPLTESQQWDPRDPHQAVMMGETNYNGLQIGLALDPSELTREELQKLIRKEYEDEGGRRENRGLMRSLS